MVMEFSKVNSANQIEVKKQLLDTIGFLFYQGVEVK